MAAYDGQIALVTGASRGLGRVIALELAAAGADVVVNYAASQEAAEAVAETIRGLGRRAVAVRARVEDEAEVKAMFKRLRADFGRLDVLVNNAGILERSFLMTTESETFQKVLSINVLGAFHCLKAAARLMIRQRAGAVVNVSSLAGLRGLVGQGAYATSKSALHGLTTVAAKELARYGVRVNAVAPGVVDTGMMHDMSGISQEDYLAQIPLGRAAQPEEVARAIAFLASGAASYITGHVLPIDGGMFVGKE